MILTRNNRQRNPQEKHHELPNRKDELPSQWMRVLAHQNRINCGSFEQLSAVMTIRIALNLGVQSVKLANSRSFGDAARAMAKQRLDCVIVSH
jgi:hypothetical protein